MWILLDMDGTLTPSGRAMARSLDGDFRKILREHRDCGSRIAVVSGATLSRMRSRLVGWWGAGVVDMWASSNGSEVWADGADEPQSRVAVGEIWGEGGVERVQTTCAELHEAFKAANPTFRYTGPFVETRTALVNWSPIGRGATLDDRAVFQEADTLHGIRGEWLPKLRTALDGTSTAVSLGGKTSFDIFPAAHGKDQILSWATGDAWYIADAIGPDGNDWPLARRLGSQVLATRAPVDTLRLLRDVIPRTSPVKL